MADRRLFLLLDRSAKLGNGFRKTLEPDECDSIINQRLKRVRFDRAEVNDSSALARSPTARY
jgi:hypothetical protein